MRDNQVPYLGTCHHHRNGHGKGKRLYATRAMAKKAGRLSRHGKMAAYPCEHHPGMWHHGHLRDDVRQGHTTRGEAYRGEA